MLAYSDISVLSICRNSKCQLIHAGSTEHAHYGADFAKHPPGATNEAELSRSVVPALVRRSGRKTPANFREVVRLAYLHGHTAVAIGRLRDRDSIAPRGWTENRACLNQGLQ